MTIHAPPISITTGIQIFERCRRLAPTHESVAVFSRVPDAHSRPCNFSLVSSGNVDFSVGRAAVATSAAWRASAADRAERVGTSTHEASSQKLPAINIMSPYSLRDNNPLSPARYSVLMQTTF